MDAGAASAVADGACAAALVVPGDAPACPVALAVLGAASACAVALAVLGDVLVCPAALADAALAAAGGSPGTGLEAWAGAKTARRARSAAAMRGSKGCLDSIHPIISSAAHALRRRFALRDSLEYTSPPFFDPLCDPYE